MTLYRALFYDPGHFHAALTLRTPNPRLAPDLALRESAAALGPTHGPSPLV